MSGIKDSVKTTEVMMKKAVPLVFLFHRPFHNVD